MPSVAEKLTKDARAVAEKHHDLQEKLQSSRDRVKELQRMAFFQLLPSICEQLDLQDEGKARVKAFISDEATLFRFFRRSRYNHEQALTLLNASLLWRIRTDLDLLSATSLHPLYVTPPSPNPPLFWINSNFRDHYGRPCGVIHLRSVERTAENTLDELKEYIVVCMEVIRRFVTHLYQKAAKENETFKAEEPSDSVLQMVIAIDLAGSGMANLELELLPFLLDLLKNHFPGMVGAVYVLHYGWVHSGMWAVAKRVLPQQALARIFFPSEAQLCEHFDVSNLPKAYGGELDVEINSTSNDVLRRFGKPRRVSSVPTSPMDSPDLSKSQRTLSRTSSYESIYEVFYSANGTPWTSRPITPRYSAPSTPRGDHNGAPLKMTPSAARKLRHLQMTRGELSAAAEAGDEERIAERRRSASDPRIEDARAVGLMVNTGFSPVAIPKGGMSPAVRGRREVERRHVRFSPSASRTHSHSPHRRVGTSRNFTLYLPADENETLLPSESESDASGKDGEKPNQSDASSSEEQQGGFLSRWRRDRRASSGAQGPMDDKAAAAAIGRGSVSDADFGYHDTEDMNQDAGAVTYIDPGSPQLQVPHLSEPPLHMTSVSQHSFSHRSRKYEGRAGHVSPYNVNNPFFGYPAYIGPQTAIAQEASGGFHLAHSNTPQHLHARRRKRDLMRTLTYLFVLRILAFHRKLRWRAILLWKEFARTISVAGEDQADGDRLWRMAEERHRRYSIAAQGLSSEEKQRQQRKKNGILGSKLLFAIIFVMLLKPSWRKAVGSRISLGLASLNLLPPLTQSKIDLGETIYENVDVHSVQVPSYRAPSSGHTRSGFHIREKLGIKTAAGNNSNSKGSRYRGPFVVAGGALALASLGMYLYSQYGGKQGGGGGDDGDDDQDDRRDDTPASNAACSSINLSARPSLSICLSPHFDRSSSSIAGLRTLLEALASVFLIHLICPAPGLNIDDEENSTDEVEDLEKSIAFLTNKIGDIEGFDPRRILEFSKPAGRWAISRALACDCHLELILEPSRSDVASSQVELEKIRRSCGLVVIAAIGSEKTEVMDAIFEGLKQKAAESGASGDAPAGMRAFERRQRDDGWESVANDVRKLRDQWK